MIVIQGMITNDQGYHEQDHNHSFEYDFFVLQTDIFAVDFFYIFLQCIFIEEELVNTMLDVCDGDGDGDDGGRKRETVVLVSYPSGCSR